MKSVHLAYGKKGISLPLDIPGMQPEVFLPQDPPALRDPRTAFLEAVRSPQGSEPLKTVA
jgi:hypothetical protein